MKKILFTLAAIAIVCGSLALSFTRKNSKTSSLQLSELVQNANATMYYTQKNTNVFLSGLNSDTKAIWYKNIYIDIPCDDVSTQYKTCIYGGFKPCSKITNPNIWYVTNQVNISDSSYHEIARGADSDGEEWILF